MGDTLGSVALCVRRTALLLLPALALLAFTATADATTIDVTTTANTGPGSLRQAIKDANSLAGPDRIEITATGTIELLSELPHLNSDMTIAGPGFAKLDIHRDGPVTPSDLYSVLTIKQGVTVHVSGVTISGGAGSGGRGGGIYNNGALTLTRAVVSHNTATEAPAQGGGIYNIGVLTLIGSAVANNTAGSDANPGFGGGIENDPTFGGSVSIEAGSLIRGNKALGNGQGGGGLATAGGTINIFNSTFARNFTNAFGGAINASGGVVSLIRTTVADNKTNGDFGGGISMFSPASVTLDRSTMSGNVATSMDGFGIGGAIEALSGTLDINNSTIDGNRAHDFPAMRTGATVTLNSSVIGDPLGGGTNCGFENSGTITSTGHNVVSDHSCIFSPTTGDKVADPKLEPFGYYGGFTFTAPPKASSPAVANGDPATCGTRDQRLLLIANDGDAGGCDSGAVEYFKPPKNLKRPKVKGKPKPGHELTCKKGKWSGGTPITYAYQWYRGHKKISGQTAKAYDVGSHDSGHSLRCKVTAKNPGGKTKKKSRKIEVS